MEYRKPYPWPFSLPAIISLQPRNIKVSSLIICFMKWKKKLLYNLGTCNKFQCHMGVLKNDGMQNMMNCCLTWLFDQQK